MNENYREVLDKVRMGFPSPDSDRVHDSYFVHSMMRAIDKVDTLKSKLPILGHYTELDYDKALSAKINDTSMDLEHVVSDLVSYCCGLSIPGHPQTHHNVIPPPTIASLIGMFLSSTYQANIVWDEYSHRVALAEVEVVAMVSSLVGYDTATSGGLFTFGGTGTTMYGLKVGLEKAVPNALTNGIDGRVALAGSEASHYCRYNIASWLGCGSNNVITVPVDSRNSMCLDKLEDKLRSALQDGVKIAGIIATMGTTDAFGIDNLAAVIEIRDRLVKEFSLPYKIHVHADAVIGWAWSVFNDYDFENNPWGFRPRTIRALTEARRDISKLHLADSIGIDFHKSGFAPYTSSMVLFKDRADLKLLTRAQESMPYLYQFGEYKPGMYTVESSRSGSGVLAALASLRLLGKQGFQVIIGHLVHMTQFMREYLHSQRSVVVLNRDNVGTVSIFRVYPQASDAFRLRDKEVKDESYRESVVATNKFNRELFDWLHKEAISGHGSVLSITDCYQTTSYGEPILGLKSYIISPFIEESVVELVSKKVADAQKHLSEKGAQLAAM